PPSIEEGLRADLALAIDPPRHQLALDVADHGSVADQVERGRRELRKHLEDRPGDAPLAPAPVGRRGGQQDPKVDGGATTQLFDLAAREQVDLVASPPEQQAPPLDG